jgi:hypothetical protein
MAAHAEVVLMSVALVVYSVPWGELLAVPNSRRQKFVTDVGRKFAARFKEIERFFLEVDPPPSCREALRQIVYGKELHPGLGDLYTGVIEVLCMNFGTSFQPGFARAPIMELDKLLKKRKCPVEVSDLAYRGSPIPIPSDGIGVGYWDPEQVVAAYFFLSGLKLPRADSSIRQFIPWINNCLEEAVGHEGDGLVGFVY